MMKKQVIILLMCVFASNGYASCAYLPQGILDAWSQDRGLWERDVSFEPVMSGEYPQLSVTAFRITHLHQQTFFFEAGFRVGDEIEEVNGVDVASSEALQSLLTELPQASEIVLSIRDKESIRLLNSEVAPHLLCN